MGAWWAVYASIACVLVVLGEVPDGDDVPRGLQIVNRSGSVASFVDDNMMKRGAVVVGIVGNGTARHRLLAELADDTDLYELLILGVQFARGNSSIKAYHDSYPAEGFAGKWTRGALRAWLYDVAYPPVARIRNDFKAHKYTTGNPFGVVLVVRLLNRQSNDVVAALEPYARKYRQRLKFTFFPKAMGTKDLCENFGIWTTDELLLVEKPKEVHRRMHSNIPLSPKYRLETVTPQRIDEFFHGYEAGTWPRYYKPATQEPNVVVQDGVRELTAWDFARTVFDQNFAVLVGFVSQNCSACLDFGRRMRQLGKMVEASRQSPKNPFDDLIIASIDQTANEHPVEMRGTPWLRYWPRAVPRNWVDVPVRTVDSMYNFLTSYHVKPVDVESNTTGSATAIGTCNAAGFQTRDCEAPPAEVVNSSSSSSVSAIERSTTRPGPAKVTESSSSAGLGAAGHRTSGNDGVEAPANTWEDPGR